MIDDWREARRVRRAVRAAEREAEAQCDAHVRAFELNKLWLLWQEAKEVLEHPWPLFAEGCWQRTWYRGEEVEAAFCNDKTAGAEPVEVDDDPGGHLPNGPDRGCRVECTADGRRRGDVDRRPLQKERRGMPMPPRGWTPKG